MSALDVILHDLDLDDYTLSFHEEAVKELLALRSAASERDAEVERAVQAEREACARVVDDFEIDTCPSDTDELESIIFRDERIAAAIRARGEPARVPCPNTGDAVYVSPCFDHNSQMYCESCKQVHRVLREVDGVKLV